MMMNRKTLGLTLALLALANYAAANGLDFLHHHKKEQAAVSGVRTVAVSGAASIAPEHITKSDRVKEALGLAGPVVAPMVPPGCKSAYSYVQGNANFTFLDNALKVTGLVSVLNDPALVATVFAPNDAAFTTTLASLGVTPQELFNDVATLTVILRYHIIPGLSLEKEDFRDSQQYDTLLTDSHKNKYAVVYNYEKQTDLKAIKMGESLNAASTPLYSIIPSGGKAAKITTFDINSGCPTVVHVINRVLIPDYRDALSADALDTAVDVLTTYRDSNATLPLVQKP